MTKVEQNASKYFTPGITKRAKHRHKQQSHSFSNNFFFSSERELNLPRRNIFLKTFNRYKLIINFTLTQQRFFYSERCSYSLSFFLSLFPLPPISFSLKSRTIECKCPEVKIMKVSHKWLSWMCHLSLVKQLLVEKEIVVSSIVLCVTVLSKSL